MELKKDNIFRSISNTLNPPAQKTSFGMIYAVVLIILMIVMSIGQFFFPISNLKSSDDESKLKTAVENAHSVESKNDYKYDDFLGYSSALHVQPTEVNDRLQSAIANAKAVNKSDYEYSMYIDYESALKTNENSIKYTISAGDKIYPLELKEEKYVISLSGLAFKPVDYKLDISCSNNHSPLIITSIMAISVICLGVCIIMAVIGIIQLLKNTNKACMTLTIAFIPMIIAKASLFLALVQIKNFKVVYISAENVAIIANPIHVSIAPVLMLVAAICVPFLSLKIIHRT